MFRFEDQDFKNSSQKTNRQFGTNEREGGRTEFRCPAQEQ